MLSLFQPILIYLLLIKTAFESGDDTISKLAVPDISENGRQIGEKLFALLNEQQKRSLAQYVLDRKK